MVSVVDFGELPADAWHNGRLEQYPISPGYRYMRVTVHYIDDLELNFEISRIEINYEEPKN